jgi:hypothetical protein
MIAFRQLFDLHFVVQVSCNLPFGVFKQNSEVLHFNWESLNLDSLKYYYKVKLIAKAYFVVWAG